MINNPFTSQTYVSIWTKYFSAESRVKSFDAVKASWLAIKKICITSHLTLTVGTASLQVHSTLTLPFCVRNNCNNLCLCRLQEESSNLVSADKFRLPGETSPLVQFPNSQIIRKKLCPHTQICRFLL